MPRTEEPATVTITSLIANSEMVTDRIRKLAEEVVARYKDNAPLFVCLLRGGVPFASRLMFAVAELDPNFQPELEYIRTSTYKNGREAGKTRLTVALPDDTQVAGRTVVILDDVLDTGRTPAFVATYLKGLGAKQVDLIVLAQKDRAREDWAAATLFGFTVPDQWVEGMGCDNTEIAPEGNRWAGSISVG